MRIRRRADGGAPPLERSAEKDLVCTDPWFTTLDRGPFDGEEDARAYWREHGEDITEEYREEHPGERPFAWWQFTAETTFEDVWTDEIKDNCPDGWSISAAVLNELGYLTERERTHFERRPRHDPRVT